jgi:hypothetical protein
MVVLQAALAVTNLNVLEVMQPSLRVVQTLSIQRGGQYMSHNSLMIRAVLLSLYQTERQRTLQL